MDESCEHAEWKKPETKDHKLFHSLYMTCPEQEDLCGQKADEWLPSSREGGQGMLMGEGFVGGSKNV